MGASRRVLASKEIASIGANVSPNGNTALDSVIDGFGDCIYVPNLVRPTRG